MENLFKFNSIINFYLTQISLRFAILDGFSGFKIDETLRKAPTASFPSIIRKRVENLFAYLHI